MTLPDGYSLRPVQKTDAPAVAELFAEYSRAFGSEASFTADELLGFWQNLNLDHNAWLVENSAGKAIAFENVFVFEDLFDIDGVVHPDFWRQGIASYLVEVVEARIQDLIAGGATSQQLIQVGLNGRDTAAVTLFAERGYQPHEHHITMQMPLTELPPAVEWQEGYHLRGFNEGVDDALVYEIVQTAFAQIEGYPGKSYAEWRASLMAEGLFDPNLWYLLEHQGASETESQVVGVCLCAHKHGMGWVRELAVLPDYQGRGIGTRLLQHAFREWYLRGERQVGLGLSSKNTPALALYTQIGLVIDTTFVMYQKHLHD